MSSCRSPLLHRNIHYLIFLKLCLFVNLADAQEKQIRFSSWNNLNVNLKLRENISLKNEIKFRSTNFLGKRKQLLIRPSLLYNFNPNIQFGFGVTYSKTYRSIKLNIPINTLEKNIWQEIHLKYGFINFNISHRIRLEERFKENILKEMRHYAVEGYNYKNRLRYRFSIEIPMGREKKFNFISLSLKDEILLNTTNGFIPETLDENRFYLGFIIQIRESIKLSTGYLYICSFDCSKNLQISNNILVTSLSFSL